MKEVAAFKLAVQGKPMKASSEIGQPSLLYSSTADVATTFGLKGIIRTSDSSSSMSQLYSKQLFGGDDDNPATRQRLKRENAAQRAVEKARNIVALRNEAEQNNTSYNASAVSNIMNRFCSSSSMK